MQDIIQSEPAELMTLIKVDRFYFKHSVTLLQILYLPFNVFKSSFYVKSVQLSNFWNNFPSTHHYCTIYIS
jgi:hypothetical protein